MSVNATLYLRATTHDGLSALIGTRFYPNRLKQDCDFPAIRYLNVSSPDEYTTHSSSGTDTRQRYRYQLDGYADTPDGLEDLRIQMYDAFHGYHAGKDLGFIFVKNFFDADALEINKHRVIMDIVIDHNY